MYKVKPNQRNFERCQRLIELSISHQLPTSELLGLISWADRNTLRMSCYYRPFQTLLYQHAPALIAQFSIAKSPRLLAKTTAIYSHLNLYSSAWMNHVATTCQKWLHSSQPANLEDFAVIYKCFVELQVKKEDKFRQELARKVLHLAEKQIEGILKKAATQEEKLRVVENVHKYMRTFLLDPLTDKQSIQNCLQKMHSLFEDSKLQSNFAEYPYNHSAYFFQLLKLTPNASRLLSGYYLKFLEDSYQTNREFRSRTTRENTSRQFQRRGQSVFEIRFQRNLQENGYWFERNLKIGLSEYDIVLKGKLSQEFRPFSNLTHSKGKQIGREELATFQKMNSMWTIDRKDKWNKSIVVNLNGPYHFIEGDSEGMTRSEEVKSDLLKYYGYDDFRTVDYRIWERETTNQQAVRLFLQQFLAK